MSYVCVDRKGPGRRVRVRPATMPVSFAPPGAALGFSLKPPKYLRKFQPGKVLKKLAVPAAIGATLFIPGVAPALATVGRGVVTGIKGAGSAVVGLFRPKPKLPTQSLQAALGLPTLTPKPRTGILGLGIPPFSTPPFATVPESIPTVSPVPSIEQFPTVASPQYDASGGGGGAGSGIAPAPSAEPGPGEPAPQAASLLVPGLILLGVMAMSRRKRR